MNNHILAVKHHDATMDKAARITPRLYFFA
jgi:hypothetical protein